MKCFYTFKNATAALMVLWFEPDIELVILNPDLPVKLDSVNVGERVYILNDAISLEQMQALAMRGDIVWICNDARLIEKAFCMTPKVCSSHRFRPSETLEELTWSWFSEEPMPPSMFISFVKPQFNCLEIAIPRSK